MKWYRFKYRAASGLASVQDGAGRLLRAGSVRCLRLALALVAGLLTLAALVAFVLVALLVLAPAALVVVILGGLALAAWPFKVPKLPETPEEDADSC